MVVFFKYNDDLLQPQFQKRVSSTPARYRHTLETEVVTAKTGELRWRREFYEAVDIVQSELERRFDQDSMRIAIRRKETVIDAAKGRTAVELDIQSLHIPKQLDTGRLQLQLRMLGDITKDSPRSTVPEVASYLAKLHPQTRGLFREVENMP